jgi:hypothetical protein
MLAPYSGIWADAANLVVNHDFVLAAELLDRIGHLPAEALANMYAGGANLQKALEFWQMVGATRYINAIEAGELG